MPSNNAFASFVHFQISFTLVCTLMIRMNENFTGQQRRSMKIDSLFVSYAMLFSCLSVLCLGIIFIFKAIFVTDSGGQDYQIFGDSSSNLHSPTTSSDDHIKKSTSNKSNNINPLFGSEK